MCGCIDIMPRYPVMLDENTCVKIKATKTDQQLIIKYIIVMNNNNTVYQEILAEMYLSV